MFNRISNYFNCQIIITTFVCLLFSSIFQIIYHEKNSSDNAKEDLSEPVVIGHGEGVFKVGELLYSDNFNDENEWDIQIQDSDADTDPIVNFGNGILEVVMPDRGATIWNRNKFSGPVAITYKATASTDHIEMDGIVVRDINTFWHTSDPENPEAIFDDEIYTGAFDSYHRQQGYYASIGGRDNTTTRFRKYPRKSTDGEPVEHISLSERDGLDDYLIQPDKTHTIQLVVYEDVVQYIVDGEVFYEIREGDSVQISRRDGSVENVEYTEERFPSYNEGWFGFRLVNTHHLYSDFRVYRLEAVD